MIMELVTLMVIVFVIVNALVVFAATAKNSTVAATAGAVIEVLMATRCHDTIF